MEIAVCDDDSLDRNLTAQQLRRCLYEKSTGGGITCFNNAVELIYEIQDGKVFDLIFMDIYMDKLLGIDAARQLRAIGYHGKIVFLTGTAAFAVESYEVQASGYLLKPVTYEKLSAFMNGILSRLSNEVYRVKRRGEIISIHYNEILFIESCNSKCLLHNEAGEVIGIYKHLSDIEQELNDSRFLRCHQSYLVNMNHIVHADKNFNMANGETVLIRQKNIREIKQQYLDFMSTK
ncbi:MAG: response regulator transcription factor [Clostridia bacterium]|nr:response regulator transcription factor [Clostridia bacterium]